MNAFCLRTLQRIIEPLPIRGKGRIAQRILSGVNGEVYCHPVAGGVVSLRTTQRIERWMWAGAYETELVSLMKRTLKADMVFFDIGANIGYFSVIGAALVGSRGRVVAFEPMPDNFARLQTNLQRFEWTTACPFAVGNTIGEQSIYYSRKESGWASLEGKEHAYLDAQLRVKVTRLDDWLRADSLDRLDLMKLDVEGAELDVLRGAREIIDRFRPMIVAESKQGWHRNEICELLGVLGYRCDLFHGDCILAIPSTVRD